MYTCNKKKPRFLTIYSPKSQDFGSTELKAEAETTITPPPQHTHTSGCVTFYDGMLFTFHIAVALPQVSLDFDRQKNSTH